MKVKAAGRVDIKDADKGEVSVVFSTLDVVDSDGDVTRPGAFENGAKTRISAYQHTSWSGSLPVGKGVIRELKTEAVMDGRFFLDTAHGADTFATVKEMGDLQEWSYGYDVTKASFGEFEDREVRFLEGLKVHEVSPVLLGAGVNTRTLSAKSGEGLRFAEHVASVLADVDALTTRAAEVVALRAEKGKAMSDASAGLLRQIDASLKRLSELLAEPAEDSTTPDDVLREYARFVALTQECAA